MKIEYRKHTNGKDYFRYYRRVGNNVYYDHFTTKTDNIYSLLFARKTLDWMNFPCPSWQRKITKEEYEKALKDEIKRSIKKLKGKLK